MDLVKAWVAALLVWTVGFVLQSFLFSAVGTIERLEEVGWRILLIHLPWLVLLLVTAAVAALVHRRRAEAGRHAVAVLTVPLLALLLTLVLSIGTTETAPLLVDFMAGAIGAVAGWQLVDRLVSRRRGSLPY